MSIISKTEDSAVFSKFQELVSKWLREIDATRVDVEYNVIALTGEVMTWVVVDGERKSVHLPSSLSYPMYDVRPSQVDSHRGAWLYSHFWMEAAEGVLHQEADWMREPVISASPIVGADAVVELEYYPRDPEWIPEWMTAKIAEYHEEEARESQKADTEAAQAEGNGADEPSSGRGGRSAIE